MENGKVSTTNGKIEPPMMQAYLSKTDAELAKLFKLPGDFTLLNRLPFDAALPLYRKAVFGS